MAATATRIDLKKAANKLIVPAKDKKELYKYDGNTQDIVQALLEVEKDHWQETKAFARLFPATYKGLEALYWFVKENVSYQEDDDGKQWIQSPAHLWFGSLPNGLRRTGDCKSFTVFIVSVLKNMGLAYDIKFVSYKKSDKRVTHVYPVAYLHGKPIIMDAVYFDFNREKKPFYYAKNIRRMAEIYKLSGIGSVPPDAALKSWEKNLQRIINEIPDSVLTSGAGDLTQLTAGELERLQTSELWNARANNLPADSTYRQELKTAAKMIKTGNIAGIGALPIKIQSDVQAVLNRTDLKNQPAFTPPVFTNVAVSGVLQDIGKFFTEAWKKLVNFIFKGPAKLMAPYYLFKFITNKGKINSNTSAGKDALTRLSAQERNFKWIQDNGRFDQAQLLREMATGITEQAGKTPTELLKLATESKISGGASVGVLPVAAVAAATGFKAFVIKAIPVILDIIKKIVSVFNKKNTNELAPTTEQYGSDLMVLNAAVEEPATQAPANNAPAPGSGGGGNTLLLLLAAGGAAYALSR